MGDIMLGSDTEVCGDNIERGQPLCPRCVKGDALAKAVEGVELDAVVTTWPDLPATQISVDKAKWENLRSALAAYRRKG